MSASVLVSAGRATSGLSQIELALRSGIAGSSQSLIEHGKRQPTVETLETILLATRHTLVIIPTVRSDAAQIASEIAIAVAANDEKWAFRRFIQLADNLAAETGATRVGLTLTEPSTTGSEQWDLAIAALSEYRLNSDHLPIPTWVTKRKGREGDNWVPRASSYDIKVDLRKVPKEFRSRGISIEADTLESV